MCSQTFISLEHILSQRYCLSSMYVFTRKSGIEVQLIMFIATKHATAGALFHRQPTIYWIFTVTNKTEQYLQTKVFVP